MLVISGALDRTPNDRAFDFLLLSPNYVIRHEFRHSLVFAIRLLSPNFSIWNDTRRLAFARFWLPYAITAPICSLSHTLTTVDKIDLPAIALTDVVKVMKAAHHYQMERLSQLCEAHLQANLSLDNLWDVLSLAHTQKVERAKTLCMEFAYTHHDAVLGDPRFRKLDVDLIVDESQLYSKYRAQLEGGWRPPAVEVTAPSTMVEDFKQLYDSLSGADHVVVVEKQPIRCHKAILGHASPTLMEFADAKDGSPLPKEFKSVSANTFSALLRYLYYGNTDIEPMAATQLISFAKQLGLTTLVDICEAKIRHGIDNSTCLSILEVAYHPILKDRDELQKELKTNCRSYFIDHIREIDVAPLKSMDAAIGADLLLSVQKQIGVSWNIGEGGSSTAPNGNMTPSSSGTHVAGDKHRKKASRMSSSFEAKKTGAMSEEDHSSAEAPATAHVPLGSGNLVGNAVAASAHDDSDDSESHSKSKEEKPASTPSAAAAAHAAAHQAAIEESKSDAASSQEAPATPIAVAAAVAEEAATKKDAEETSPAAAEKHEDEVTSVPSSPKVSRSESKREKKDKLKDGKDDKKAAAAATATATDEKEDSGSKNKEEGKKDKKDKSKDKKEKEKSKDKKKKE